MVKMKKAVKKNQAKKAETKLGLKGLLNKDFLFSKYPDLVIGLKKEKYKENEIHKILNDIN
jgi:hypothetical protein